MLDVECFPISQVLVVFPISANIYWQMRTNDDMELLQDYALRNSEDAFAALVSRYVNLVYSVGLRQTGNAQHAEEITQAVFLILARKARGLRRETVISSWLFQTARLTAANLLL